MQRTDLRSGRRREQILDAARALFDKGFDKGGPASVTTRQIAQAVGISQPSLYAHFKSVDEIGDELCFRAFRDLHECLLKVLDKPLGPRQRVSAMARAYVEFGRENPAVYRLAFMRERRMSSAADKQTDFGQPSLMAAAWRLCLLVMQEAVAAAMADEQADATVVTQLLWAHLHGLIWVIISHPDCMIGEKDRQMIDKYIDHLPV